MWLCLLACLLAGCATGPRADSARAPDWQQGDFTVTTLPPAPTIAPPPTAPPALPLMPGSVPYPGGATVFTNRAAETWVPLARWARANGLPAPKPLTPAPMPAYTWRSTNGSLLFYAGSRTTYWNGLELHLGYAPQVIRGEPVAHWLDVKQTLQPLLCGAPGLAWNPGPVIIIDPGHGGENVGAPSVLGGHYEKEFTLDWARRLQRLLLANGWQALLTRTSDIDLSLSNRVAFAEERKAALFLSLHFNSASSSDQNEAGLETYCLTPAGLPSNLTRGYFDDLAVAFPNNAFDTQNLLLALSVHRALLQATGSHDRGVRRARFPGVLRGQQRPAILIEGGYLSNPHEARQIADPAYRQKLAEAVAKALGCRPTLETRTVAAGKSLN
jgi:N-acetylmuramoyl-L-alanine amidase